MRQKIARQPLSPDPVTSAPVLLCFHSRLYIAIIVYLLILVSLCAVLGELVYLSPLASPKVRALIHFKLLAALPSRSVQRLFTRGFLKPGWGL